MQRSDSMPRSSEDPEHTNVQAEALASKYPANNNNNNNNNKKRPPPSTTNGSQLADGKAVREEKRRKWLAKQEKKMQQGSVEQQREDWIQQHSQFATRVTMDDYEKLDALRPYRDLQESDKKAGTASLLESSSDKDNQRYFIAEGTETVRLLIQQFMEASSSKSSSTRRFPPIALQSIFVKPSAFFEPPVSLLQDVEKCASNTKSQSSSKDNAPPFQVLIGSEDVQSQVVGFPFSRGALAVGIVPPWNENEEWLHHYLKSHPRYTAQQSNEKLRPPMRLLALDGICDTANLGSMIRCASAFGMDAILLSQDCCDVWYRRAVRVSMGHCCRLPCVRVHSLADTLRQFKTDFGVESYAAVIDTDSELILERVKHGDIAGAWCCVMGNEGNGISRQVIEACSKRIRIDMMDGVDSLSVPIATGILLHGLRERESTM